MKTDFQIVVKNRNSLQPVYNEDASQGSEDSTYEDGKEILSEHKQGWELYNEKHLTI